MTALATGPETTRDVVSRDSVVSVQGLTKRFPSRRGLKDTLLHPFDRTTTTVVSDVTFTANAGEFLGLLGPNGAGKTTLLKMLSTLILPDAGSATIEGLDIVRDAKAVRALVSPCLAMERSLYHRLTARQNLAVFADLQGIERQDRERRVSEVLEAVSLSDTGEKLVGQFSSGMLQRLLIARSLLTKPRLLLLDEPTRSLDPISARAFRSFLRTELASQRGCAVILATHNAEEAFELCDRVAVLNHGRLLASGVAADLSRDFLGVRYRLTTSQPDHPALREIVNRGVSVLGSVATSDHQSGGWHDLTLRLERHHDPSDVLALLAGGGMRIAAFEPVRASLADLIEGVVNRGEDA
jgi:ABC-2 type transport system ATP-binding protein